MLKVVGPLRRRVAVWLRACRPAPTAVDVREGLRMVCGAFLGVGSSIAAGHLLAGPAPATAWLLAPVGASAVLVFATPASALAQPWPVIAGNGVSAFAGMACSVALPNATLAAAFAIAAAIAAMFALRCLHPPGGAAALLAVLAHEVGGRFPLGILLFDAVLLVLFAAIYHRLTGRSYPCCQRKPLASPA